ncbi:MAG: integrase [Nitrospirae bacterium RBG_16_64_22]|nr:MAG: integrase [Nitrospirae bacterium RBG_16_64_22]
MIDTVTNMGPRLGIAPTCTAMGLARATYYRTLRPRHGPHRRRTPSRTLSRQERQGALAILHEPRFVDRAPAEVYATLLDEGQYLCSERTMYRILAENQEVRERRDQLRHPNYHKPELLATAPNQVWSWDITKLLGPVKWTYFYLYVLLDIYSRYAAGWLLAREENSSLAKRLIEETCRKEGILPGQLIIHSDRGSPMTSKPVALMLSDLGVTKSLSRPQVSNDNPYSEAQFKTLKYRPSFPDRFGSIQDARAYCRDFFTWYNTEHRHSGIGMMTPEAVHQGRASEVTAARQQTLFAAYGHHPERFVHRPPSPPALPSAAWINPPQPKTAPQDGTGSTISLSDDLSVDPIPNDIVSSLKSVTSSRSYVAVASATEGTAQ